MIELLFNNGNDYYDSHSMVRTVQKDKIDTKLVYIYCTDTIWTKYLSEPKYEGYGLSIGKDMVDDFEKSMEDIDAVYYLSITVIFINLPYPPLNLQGSFGLRSRFPSLFLFS
jgi:hypothetical protein